MGLIKMYDWNNYTWGVVFAAPFAAWATMDWMIGVHFFWIGTLLFLAHALVMIGIKKIKANHH